MMVTQCCSQHILLIIYAGEGEREKEAKKEGKKEGNERNLRSIL